MIANLRNQLEELNHYKFSDTEWERFFSTVVANANDGIVEKTAKIQEDNIQVLKRDDGMTKNITLIDRENIHNNRLQVINQYVVKTEQGARHDNRYDVTVLVNGFPLVHVELKRRGVAIREAVADSLNMFRFLLSVTEHIQSIIPTVLVTMQLRIAILGWQGEERRAIALSLHHFGQMLTIK